MPRSCHPPIPIRSLTGPRDRQSLVRTVFTRAQNVLVLAEACMRAVMLLVAASDSFYVGYAALEAADGFLLLAQVAVFMAMDALKEAVPLMRMNLGFYIALRFLESFTLRHYDVIPAETAPLTFIEEVLDWRRRQDFIKTIDWTVLVLSATAILTVFTHPYELAFVRLRCNAQTYITHRQCARSQKRLRVLRRDEEVADDLVRAKLACEQLRHRSGPKDPGASLRQAASLYGSAVEEQKRESDERRARPPSPLAAAFDRIGVHVEGVGTVSYSELSGPPASLS